MLAPAGLVVYLLPGAWSAGGFVFAILFAWAVKVALIEPFAIACNAAGLFQGGRTGRPPNPEWVAKLDSTSDKFRKLGERALGWATRGRAAPAPGGSPDPA